MTGPAPRAPSTTRSSRGSVRACPGSMSTPPSLPGPPLPWRLRLGYRVSGGGPASGGPWHAGAAPSWELRAQPTTAAETQALGAALGRALEAGDVVVLTGGLGAGKTTFTQGLGAGLGVRGGIISPTFVLVRIHPNLADGQRPGARPRPRRRVPA
ncbi:tRNA (adenosine(37)-N6)-threonylcarbamoyltransferase complex ATPase subunit type 1 TsaE [Sinomonas sp. P47F7]|uniref:tRNA (adenosine(37)-N6)-threonylcarbamoyltransferase complex ATPase subunit type 1 TsaE n=1 Tax=Sinomonas sp. P47F7 TaxID=3410987 RepID=UPI003BF50C84